MEKERNQRSARCWAPLIATCSFSAALFVALAGSLLTISTWVLGAPAHPLIRDLGTILLVLTIPLLVLCGCCLDWADGNSVNARVRDSEAERRSIGRTTMNASNNAKG